MDELFKQIIIGEKEVKELDNSYTNMNKKVRNLNEIAKYFLKTSRRKYKEEKLKKRDINKLLFVYNDLIKENRTIKKYVNSKEENQDLFKDAERIIKLFVDDFCKSRENTSIWTREIKVAGFVEPLLFGLITLLLSVIFLGNLYLMI